MLAIRKIPPVKHAQSAETGLRKQWFRDHFPEHLLKKLPDAQARIESGERIKDVAEALGFIDESYVHLSTVAHTLGWITAAVDNRVEALHDKIINRYLDELEPFLANTLEGVKHFMSKAVRAPAIKPTDIASAATAFKTAVEVGRKTFRLDARESEGPVVNNQIMVVGRMSEVGVKPLK